MNGSIFPWLRFLRLSAVLTVPGDVLAGAVLGGGMEGAGPAVLGVSLAYLFGMGLNDVMDVEADRRERPERPLPSGSVSWGQAVGVSAALALGAVAALPEAGMVLLLGLIVGYTVLKDRIPVPGVVLMGSCRAAAVWLGAGAPGMPSLPLGIAMGLWAGFIVLVTVLARAETREVYSGALHWVVPMWLVAGLLGLGYTVPGPDPLAYVPGGVLLVLANVYGGRIQKAGRIRPQDIGHYLGLLFWMQSFVLALAGEWLWMLLILALWLVKRLSRRWVPVS